MEATIDWSMGSRAAALVDWGTVSQTGRRVGSSGPPTPSAERARMLGNLPLPIRFLLRTVGAWQFRRYVTRLRAS